MKRKALFTLIFCLLSSSFLFGQGELDSIVLLNGRVYRGEVIGLENGFLKYKEVDKKGNTLTSELAEYRVFSYVENRKEHFVYEMDEFKNNFLTVEQAQYATLGSYDARKMFKPRIAFWSTFALCYSAVLFDTYLGIKSIEHKDYIGPYTSPGFFKSNPTIFPFFIPAIASVSWSFPSFRVRKRNMIQKYLYKNESYYRGYHRVAKQKRMLGALTGGLIGVGTGLLTYGIFKK